MQLQAVVSDSSITNIGRKSNIQLNFNGSNIFRTLEICSRNGQFEPLSVNHSTRSDGKWGNLRLSFLKYVVSTYYIHFLFYKK